MPESREDRILVAVDFDGVIADTNRVKSRWIRRRLDREVPPALCNRTDCVPLIGVGQYEAMAAEVYGEEATLATPAVEGAAAGLAVLAATHRFILVTARTPERLSFAARWLDRHGFSIFFPDRQSSASGWPKVDIAAANGAAALIDDDPRHLIPQPAKSLRLILFSPGYPRAFDPEVGIDVADSWNRIVRLLEPGGSPSVQDPSAR